MESRRNALWIPLIQWALFIFARRHYFGLVHWEYETALDEDDKKENKESAMMGSLLLFPNLRRYCYFFWIYTLPMLPVLIWHAFLRPHYSPTDLNVWPGALWVLLLSIFSTGLFKIFLSMMNFQYCMIVWMQPWKSGVAFMTFNKENQFGLIY
jgi:hypothetical protein